MLLRLFFDAGSGVLLWAYDDEAKARFGYPVESADLNIPAELRAEIEQLITDYDDTFPWDDPASGIVVEPEATSIRDGFRKLLDIRPEWRKMGEQGRLYALEHLRWDRIAQQAFIQYKSVDANCQMPAIDPQAMKRQLLEAPLL